MVRVPGRSGSYNCIRQSQKVSSTIYGELDYYKVSFVFLASFVFICVHLCLVYEETKINLNRRSKLVKKSKVYFKLRTFFMAASSNEGEET